MIFRNLGATMNGYDVRTGYEGTLQADPFTAMLSNCGYDGTFLKTTSRFPDEPYPDKWKQSIGNKFGLSYVPINNITESSLRSALAAKGYVLIYFNANTTKMHFMVLTRLDYGSGELYDKAYVLDPAAKSYSAGSGATGNGILLSQTTSNHSDARIGDISWAGYFE